MITRTAILKNSDGREISRVNFKKPYQVARAFNLKAGRFLEKIKNGRTHRFTRGPNKGKKIIIVPYNGDEILKRVKLPNGDLRQYETLKDLSNILNVSRPTAKKFEEGGEVKKLKNYSIEQSVERTQTENDEPREITVYFPKNPYGSMSNEKIRGNPDDLNQYHTFDLEVPAGTQNISRFINENLPPFFRQEGGKYYYKDSNDSMDNLLIDNEENLIIPWKNYASYKPTEKNQSCIYDFIVKKYSKKIPIEKIEWYFNKEKMSNTLLDFECFAENFKIPTTIFDIFGNLIYKHEGSSNQLKTNIILFRNHVFNFTGKNPASIPKLPIENFSEEVIDKTNQIFIRVGNKFVGKNGSFECAESVLDNKFFTGTKANFNFDFEKDILPKMIYYVPFKQTIIEKTEFDLKKAFYNSIMDSKHQIPVFSVVDDWVKYENQNILNYSYYIVDLHKETEYSPLVKNRTFHGFVIKYLINNGIITTKDISFCKNPSYVYPIKYLKQKFNEFDVLKGKSYKYYVGIMSKIYNSISREVLVYTENYNETKADFINQDELGWSKNEEYDEKNKFTKIKLTKNSHKVKNINSRNVAGLVYDSVNLDVFKFIIKNNVKMNDIIALRVDGLIIDGKCKFSYDEKKWDTKKYTGELFETFNENIYINPVVEQKKEIEEFGKNNIILRGRAGTGKTYKYCNELKNPDDFATSIANIIVQKLRTDLEGSIDSKNINSFCSTFKLFLPPNKLLKTLKKYKNKTIFFDEYSMLKRVYLNYIYLATKLYNISWIMAGDLAQIPPISENQLSLKTCFFRNFFPKKINLTTNYRIKDKQWLRKLNYVAKTALKFDNSRARRIRNDFNINYSQNINSEIPEVNLAYTHRTRRAINAYILDKKNMFFDRRQKFTMIKNEKTNDLERISIKWSETTSGIKLQCKKNIKINYDDYNEMLFNSELFVVKKVKYDNLKNKPNIRTKYLIKSLSDEYKKVWINAETLHFFVPAYCLTIHSCQGLTLEEKYGIWDTELMYSKGLINILYTAVSRGRKPEQITIFTRQGKEFNKKVKKIFEYWNDEPKKDENDHLDNADYEQFKEIKFVKK